MSLEKNLKISRLFDEYSAVLSENQKLVMTEYYFEDKTLSEIAIGDLFKIGKSPIFD